MSLLLINQAINAGCKTISDFKAWLLSDYKIALGIKGKSL